MNMSIPVPLVNVFDISNSSTFSDHLYLSHNSADVYFVFKSENGEIERIPAHKYVLIAVSDVYEVMFNGTWTEKNKVDISNISAEAFREFLQFFYLRRIKLTEENVAAVMDLGNMYNVDHCLLTCVQFVKNIINFDNVCWCYELAILYDQTGLKKMCESMIGLKTTDVLKSSCFLESGRRVIAGILKLKWLTCTELELFDALIAWILASSGQNVLTKTLVEEKYRDLFEDICIGSITEQQLDAFFKNYRMLLPNDEVPGFSNMFKFYFASIFNSKRVCRFGTDPWRCASATNTVCDRFISRGDLQIPYEIKNVEVTHFSTTHPLLIKSIDLVSIHYEYSYEKTNNVATYVQIIEDAAHKQNTILFVSKCKYLKYRTYSSVVLPEPIFVKPGFLYRIELRQCPPENCVTGVTLKPTVQLESGAVLRFYEKNPHQSSGRNVARGVIRGLHVCQLPDWKN